MSEHFDANALFSELKAKTRTIDFGDPPEPFELQHPSLWPIEVTRAVKADDLEALARAVLGSDRFDRFVELGGTPGLLKETIERVFGGPVGESSASSSS